MSEKLDIHLIIYFLFWYGIALTEMIELKNVQCAPHPDTIETDPKQHRFFPYVVKLHRCQGSWQNYSLFDRHCAPAEINTFQLRVKRFDASGNAAIGFVKVENHTKCTGVCARTPDVCTQYQKWSKDTCRCQCKFPSTSKKNPCCEGKVWNSFRCDCVCPPGPRNCGSVKSWSDQTCSCECRDQPCSGTIDQDTCQCIEAVFNPQMYHMSDGVSNYIMVVAMVVEALVLLIFFFVFYACFFRKCCVMTTRRSDDPLLSPTNGNMHEFSNNFNNNAYNERTPPNENDAVDGNEAKSS